MSSKSLEFFGQAATKWRPFKSLAKLKGDHFIIANILKLQEYQTFDLMKIHNMSKKWFANSKLSLWKSLVYEKRAAENAIFKFLPFSFLQISNDCCKKTFEKTIRFYNGFWRFLWRCCLKYFCSTNFWL